jgi:flagellar protein FlgJ
VGLNSIQRDNLRQAAKMAYAVETISGLPGLLTLAQWALESAWGLSQPGNNPFGIKAYPNNFGTQVLPTWEVKAGIKTRCEQTFATFPTLADAFLKHTALLVTGKPYFSSFQRYLNSDTKDLEQFVRDIARNYATDPHYADKLLAIMRMPEVRGEWLRASGSFPEPHDA